MEMKDIIQTLKNEFNAVDELYTAAENKALYHMAEAEKAEAEMKKYEKNRIALSKMLEAYKEGNFEDFEEPAKAEKTEPEKKNETGKETEPEKKIIGLMTFPKENKPIKRVRNTKGEVWRFAPNGEVLDKYTSQHDAAKRLRWDQSGISKFMRKPIEAQLRLKGFYMEFMGC